MDIKTSPFGKLNDGNDVKLFTLTNNTTTIKITNYGAIITSIEMPDKQGNIDNIVCGFNNLESYISDEYTSGCPYFGALIGRFGNRIANGHLVIDGVEYKMAINNGPNHLHGGILGFDKKLWDAKTFAEEDKIGVELTYLSVDGEENYPGNLQVTCIYSLDLENNFSIEYLAETDKTTVVNLTNHSYFNLTGGKENILEHELELTATKMTEMVEQIPTGKIVDVANTVFDFTTSKKINRDIESLATGYDDNFVLDNETGELKYIGTLKESNSGRKVKVYTTQPGIQIYTGYWNPEFIINGKKQFGSYSGIALETQHYPDSVNRPEFPSTLLKPGELYNEKTIYKFLTE